MVNSILSTRSSHFVRVYTVYSASSVYALFNNQNYSSYHEELNCFLKNFEEHIRNDKFSDTYATEGQPNSKSQASCV